MLGRTEADTDAQRVRRLWWALPPLLLILVAGQLSHNSGFRRGGFLSAALGGAAVIHLCGAPSRRALVATMGLAAAFAIWGGAWADPGGLGRFADRPLTALGVAALVVRLIELLRLPAARRLSVDGERFLACALLVSFTAVVAVAIALTGSLRPSVLDAQVYAADGNLGFQPSFVLGRFLATHARLGALANLDYWAVPLVCAAVYQAERRRHLPGPDVLSAVLVAGVTGFAIYLLFPVAGPVYAFPHDFPFTTPRLGHLPVLVETAVPRNCMPSLHMACAIIFLSRGWRMGGAWRAVTAANAALTVLATLGFGYHYALDLAVTIPFTQAALSTVRFMNAHRRRDLRLAAFGWAFTAAWLLLLASGWPVPVPVAWGAVVATGIAAGRHL